jgi:hypothetical protein
MKDAQVSYPHPVLCNGDDIPGFQIDLEFQVAISEESISLKTTKPLITGHKGIDKRVKEGTAKWLIRIKCARTYQREIFLTNNKDWEMALSGPDYEGNVQIETEIITTIDIVNYKPKGLHEDYDDANFSIQAGGILAIGPIIPFTVNKDYDPLKAPLQSIFKIMVGTHPTGPFKTILEDKFILVYLSKEDWAEYARIRDRVPLILHSLIVVPALAKAISEISEHPTSLWSARLSNEIAKRGLSSSDPLTAAQQLLDRPLTRGFKELNTTLDKGTS